MTHFKHTTIFFCAPLPEPKIQSHDGAQLLLTSLFQYLFASVHSLSLPSPHLSPSFLPFLFLSFGFVSVFRTNLVATLNYTAPLRNAVTLRSTSTHTRMHADIHRLFEGVNLADILSHFWSPE